jgi:type IV pilus assembly protein PilA
MEKYMLRNSKGFTLIELMIVVAIIGILAAIAIPNFLAMQMRSKRAEIPSNLDGLRTAEKAYHAEWDAFTTAAATPSAAPGRGQINFSGSGLAAFENLGWVADGKVRGQYSVVATPGVSSQTDDFTATGFADVDGDSALSQYECNRAEKASMLSSNNVY